MSLPGVVLNRTGVQRLQAGHPWVFRGQIQSGTSSAGPGVVRLLDQRGRCLGRALYSPASQIALRFLTAEDREVDGPFLAERLARARDYRLKIRGGPRDACRQVFAESDGLPSLIVDQYGPHLVVQSLSAGLEPLKPLLIEALRSVFRPESILARNDPGVRSLEDLPRSTEAWFGEPPLSIDVRLGGLRFEVDPWRGQKTGLFLDQAENHAAAAGYASGRVLDAFTYNGGFALAAAGRADSVLAVDTSAEALKSVARNAARNGIGNVAVKEVNVFDFLKAEDQAGSRYDTIILDPPAFARNRSEVEGAVRGYKEINLRSMKLLNDGGFLITCSCSYHVTEDLFIDVIAAAARDLKRRVRIVEKRTQARDHPLLAGFPESYYLKCLVLQVLDYDLPGARRPAAG